MLSRLLLVLGWIIASGSFLYAALQIELGLNFFTWSPLLEEDYILPLVCALILLVVFWWLARRTTETSVLILATILCLGFAIAGIATVGPEAVDHPYIEFGRSQASPIWYRILRTAVLSAPLVSLLVRTRLGRSLRFRFRSSATKI